MRNFSKQKSNLACVREFFDVNELLLITSGYSFLFFLVTGCLDNRIHGSMGRNLSPYPDAENLTIETKADGSGQLVKDVFIPVGQNVSFFAGKRNRNGIFLGLVAATWVLDGDIGSLSVPSDGEKSEFSALKTGVGEIKIKWNGIERVINATIQTADKPVVSFNKSSESASEGLGLNGGGEWATGMENWGHRRRISLNWIGTNVSDAPIMVKLNPSLVNYSDFNGDGSDIRFFDSDNATVLNYEVDVWNPAGESVLWVRVPVVDSSGGDGFWMYYGNTSATSAANKNLTWPGGAIAVWHLSDLNDSTVNGVNGVDSGTTTQSAGLAGNSRSFDASSSLITVGDSPAIPSGVLNGTICALARSNTHAAGFAALFSFGTAANQQHLEFGRDAQLLKMDFGTVPEMYSLSGYVEPSSWNYYCLSSQGTSNIYSLYVNGLLVKTHVLYGVNIVKSLLYLGGSIHGGNFWSGEIDEVRFYTGNSVALMQLEHRSLTNSLTRIEPAQAYAHQPQVVSFKVTLSEPLGVPLSVFYATGGSASLANDLDLSLPATIDFAPGETEKTFSYSLKRDSLLEGSEKFTLSLLPNATVDQGAHETYTLNISDGGNLAPLPGNDFYTVYAERSTHLLVLANDVDPEGENLLVGAVSSPAHGTASAIGGAVYYYPTSGYIGSDAFTYGVIDKGGAFAIATVNINVVAPSPYWTGAGGNSNWSNPANWNTGAVPGPRETATFYDAGCVPSCNADIDVNTTLMGIHMTSTYTGTITQNLGRTLTIGLSGQGEFFQKGGIFVGGNSDISVSGKLTLESGQFTSTSNTLNFYPLGGTSTVMFIDSANLNFIHNNGTVRLYNYYVECGYPTSEYSTSASIHGVDFYNLTLQGQSNCAGGIYSQINTGSASIGGPNVYGLFLQTGNSSTPTGRINLFGNYQYSSSNTAADGNSIYWLSAGDQYYNGINHPDKVMSYFYVDKPSGAVRPLNSNIIGINRLQILNGTFEAPGSELVIGRRSFSDQFLVSPTGTFLHNNGTVSLQGGNYLTSTGYVDLSGQTVDFNHVNVRYSWGANQPNSRIQIKNNGGRMRVLGNLALDRLYFDSSSTGDIELHGNLTISATFQAASTASIRLAGSNIQTITDGSGRFPDGNLLIDKSGGSVELASNLNLNGSGQTCHLLNGTLNMQGYNFDINSLLTLDAGTTINRSSGLLNSGSLINNGTINP